MTGIGTARGKVGERDYSVEVRSVNNRYLDLSARFPGSWSSLEAEVKTLAQKYLRRGKVNITVNSSSAAGTKEDLVINEARLLRYHRQTQKLAKNLKTDPLRLNDLLKLPQVFEAPSLELTEKKVWNDLGKILVRAFESLVKAREKEGANLKRDIMGRTGELKRLLEKIEADKEPYMEEVHERLKARVQKLTETHAQDEDRLAREVAYLAERSDITEEITRFKSHLELFDSVIDAGREIGKKLDFTLQELNREANTIASKANQFGISRSVIEIKAQIEKIREQVQNIE
jgi:uncharacterized protein (TIGR00255 family)